MTQVNTNEEIKISVLLPVYNGIEFLQEAIESICAQTEKRWKLIVINDGSSDGSADYLDSLEDERIVVVHQENAGLSAALNEGLKYCDTQYVARMDCDDVAYPHRFATQLAFMEANPEVGLVGSQIKRLGKKRTDGGSHLPTEHDELFEALMEGHHAICHPAIFCRREVFDQVGGYTGGLGEEWDLFLKIGEKWKLANIDEVLLGYRFHKSSINGSRMRELRSRIRFKCECSRRRKEDLEPIEYEEFVEQESQVFAPVRCVRRIEEQARSMYHSAMVDILGENPLLGYSKLVTAAVIAPQLTIVRVARKLQGSPKPK